MKRTIRTLLEQGWHLVTLNNTIEIDNSWYIDTRANKAKYKEMFDWCYKLIDTKTWYGNASVTNGNHTVRFLFQNESDKLMFIMRWS